MEYYDVIIVGAGIAGTTLSYYLSQYCPDKSVLIIDKNQKGSNEGYGYRNTFKEIIDEFKIPYTHKYKGLKLGSFNETIATIDTDFYLFEYQKLCDIFYKKSNSVFKDEVAIDVDNSRLKTDKSEYFFKYLIDCSGPSFFLKKKLKMQLPCRYWVGHLRQLKNNIKMDTNYFYFNTDKNWFLEDVYPLKDKILHGYWRYTKKIDFNLIKPYPKDTFYLKNIQKPIEINDSFVIQAVSPALPLVYKNYAFLGDSFGNATPTSGAGIIPIIRTADLLAYSIKINDLKYFEKTWKKRNLNNYIKQMASRSVFKDRVKFVKLFKDDSQLLRDMVKKERFDLPPRIIKKIPKKMLVKSLAYFLLLKLKYSIAELRDR